MTATELEAVLALVDEVSGLLGELHRLGDPTAAQRAEQVAIRRAELAEPLMWDHEV